MGIQKTRAGNQTATTPIANGKEEPTMETTVTALQMQILLWQKELVRRAQR
jgi:hypothetical protein